MLNRILKILVFIDKKLKSYNLFRILKFLYKSVKAADLVEKSLHSKRKDF